jgi:hypothetical protein
MAEEDKYHTFFQNLLLEMTQPNGPSYNTWVNGLKEKFNSEMCGRSFRIISVEKVEDPETIRILIELEIRVYAKTLAGDKFTLTSHRLFGVVLKRTDTMPVQEDILQNFLIGEEIERTEGWTEQQEI